MESSSSAVAKIATLSAALLLASLVAGCGGGGSSSPRDELSKFVVDYVDHNENNCCELGMKAKVIRTRFAHSDPHWAVVAMAITEIHGNPDGTDYLVAHKIGSTWNVVGFGKGSIGCHVPARIRTELAAGAHDGAMDCSIDG